jgi:hypothetical protein
MYIRPSSHHDAAGGRLVVAAIDDGRVSIDVKLERSNVLMLTYSIDEARGLRDALIRAVQDAEAARG